MMFDGAAVVTADAAAHAPAAAAVAAAAAAPAVDAHATAPADAHTAAPSDATHNDPTQTPSAAQSATHSTDAPPAADAGHAVADQDQHHSSVTDALHDALTATAPVDLASARQEIFFVDSSLPDLNTLVANLPAHADIVYLDSHSDGLTQIAAALQGRENVDAIHIITHATEGSVVIGDSILNTASIEGQYHEILAEIGAHMSSTGDVLIYGCDFAAGTDGAATVMSLAQALNADVAASTNTTGVDGDWVLEDHVGTIETASIQATDWQHDLLLTNADSATVFYGKGNVINVLANDALGGLLQSMTIGGNPTHGSIVLNADNTITYTPTAGSSYTGTDTFTYTVKLAGILLPETQTVTVFLDHPPTITAPALVNGTEDSNLTLSGSNAIVIADSDVSQTTTTVTLSVPAGSLALASAAGLTFSQGSASGSSILTFSGSITAVNSALNGLTYTPIADANSTSVAPINLTVTAVDPSGGTTVSNVGLVLAPVADIVADTVITKQSTPASFNVLANDNFENAGRVVTGYSAPAHGSVTVDAQGNAVYTPTAGYAGTDTFTYTVTSGGSSETATVTVTTLLNYAPTISAPTTQTFNEDTTRVFSSANGNAITLADANNDILTVTLASTKGVLTLSQTTGLTFTSGDGVADASMVVSGTAAAINAALNGLQFIPVADYNGAATISVQASDGIAAVQSTSVALNLTPVADGVADSVTTSILTPITFAPLANDNFEGTPNVTAISAPLHGIALLVGNSITYTPALGYSGTDTFTYTVTSGGVTETIPITVTVGDNAPTGPASLGALATVDKGLVLVNVGLQFQDADLLDVLRFTATGLPAGLTIDPLLGTITGIVDGHASVNGVNGTGTYNVVVTATDLAGASVSSSGTIVVTNPAPIPLLGLSVGGSQDALLGIGVQALAIIDPDGDAFSITAATAAHGTVTINNDGSLSYQPNVNYYGADTITYTVRDVDGGQATGYVAVLLAQVPHLPVLSLPTIPLLLEDTPLIFANLLGQQISVGNIDGDAVTIDLNLPIGVGALSIANISNHTGVSLTQTSDTLGTHLKISGLTADVNAALNDLIYTPAADYNGPLNITIGLGKLLGGIISVNATLPIGIAAVADINDDNVTAVLNTPTSFNVLANDTFENAGRVVSSYTTPLHGTVTIDAQGNAIYTPTTGYTGSDSFTYTVTSNGTVETATVHINAILPNYAPTISAPTTLTLNEDTTQVFSSANGNAVTVADQNNDILTVTLSTNHGALTLQQTTGLTFTSGDGNADGSMTFSGSSAAINAALNGMRFIPTADYNGSATISVQASDGIAAVQSSSIAVTINPVADGVADSISTGPLAPVTFFPLANDNFEGTPMITGISQGAHGLVVLGLNGAVTYTPALGYLGADSFTYTVTSGGVSETVTVNVTVGNHAPTANGNLGTLAVFDSQLAIAVPTAQAFNDVDTLDVLHYSATGLPAGLTINSLTGLISGQVDGHASVNGVNGTGTYNVVVTATDLAGASVTSSGTIVVTNPAPVPLVGLVVTGNEDVPIDISAAALAIVDPDGDALTITGATALHGTVAINANGSIRYTPNADYNGIDTITYQVRDADGATATGYVAVTVLPIVDLPTIKLPSVTLLAEDTPLVFANILGQHLEVGNVDGDLVDVRLSVPAGLLSLTNSTGVSLSEGSTTGSTVLHFSGTTAAINAALNNLVYTPAADYNGPLNITIGLGHLTAGILTVNTLLPISIAPVADIVDDHVSTVTNAAVSFNVLANDSFENAGRVVDSHTDPLHGSISIDAPGNVTYTPATGFTGTDSFQYTVLSNGTYETATVTIAINTAPNTNPVATPIGNQSGTDSQPLNIDVHGYFTDADTNDTLSYSATGLPSGISISSTGVITGTLGSSASTAVPSGAYSVVVTASDGHGGLVSQSFVLVVANPAPTANDDTASGAEDSVITGNVLTNDSDIDRDTLQVSTTPVQGPAHGTLVLNSDGSFAYTPNANFNGTDSFTYRLIDADGGTSTATVILTVNPVNDAPISTGTIGTQTSTDSSNFSINVGNRFTDVDGDALAYTALGLPTGLSISSAGLISGQLGSSASHGGPNGDGSYSITVTASDGHGGSVSQTFVLNVGNPAPTTADSSQTTNEDTAFTATLSANDVDRDTLTFSATTPPAHGTLVLNASTGLYTYTPAANFNGTDSFTYRVVDADGGVATATVNITVNAVNDAPEAVGSIAAQTGIDAAGFNLDVANRFSDVDGDTLSYSASNLPAGLGIDANGVISGTLAPNASHSGLNGTGLYNVVITASDPSGASITQSFTLNVSNPVPLSANSAQITAEDTPITATLTATDDDVVTFTPATGPSHGTLVLNGTTGVYTYTPNSNFNGSDSFTYTVTDADGATTTATVSFTVTPVNDAPVTNGTIAAQTGNDGAPFSLNVAGAFADVDNDTLSFGATGLPAGLSIDPATGLISGTLASSASQGGTGGVYSVTIIANDGHGATVAQVFNLTVSNPAPTASNSTLVLDEDTVATGNLLVNANDIDGDTLRLDTTPVTAPQHGTLVLNANGTYIYTPASDFHGSDTFSYRVIDADGAAVTATVAITVNSVNDAPVANGTLAAQSTNDSSAFSLDASNAFRDVDSTLSYSVTGLPTGLSIDPATGLISGNVASSASQGGSGGVYSVVVSASDGQASVTQTFTLTVSNPAPTANTLTVTLAEDASATGNLLLNANDPDGDVLRLDTTPVSAPLHGSLTLNANGTYTYTPNANFNGTDSFSYRVFDADNASVIATVNFTVTPGYDAPVVNGTLPALSANDHGPVSVNVTGAFTDIDGTALTYAASGLPSGISIDPATGLISGTLGSSASTEGPGGHGVYTIVVTASDGQGGIATQTFTLTANNIAPTASNGTVPVAEDSVANGTLLNNASDADGDALTFVATSQPTHGTLVLNANGSYSYTPAANYNGSDSFNYRVTDADGGTTTATLTFNVTPVYDAPSAGAPIAAVSANDSSAVSLNVAGNFNNVDNAALIYSASGLPNGISINPTTGLISGTLGSSASTSSPDANGVYTIAVTVTDTTGATATQLFTLTAVNTLPVASNSTVNLLEDSAAVAGDLRGSASDADGDALTFAVTSGPNHGSLTFNANGTYSYTPSANYNGADSFTYRVTDADGAVSTAVVTFNIAPVYDAPVAGTPISTQVANDSSAISLNVAGNFSDADNRALTYSASGLPAGLSINATTGLISGTLGSSASALGAGGNYNVVITASDGLGGIATQAFTFTAVNTLPVASNATIDLNEDSAFNGDLRTNTADADGDSLTFVVSSGPTHGSLTFNANGTYTYTPTANFNGNDSFSYRVTDADGAVSNAVITFNIAPVYDAPVAGTPVSAQTANDGSVVSLNVAGNFSDADNRALVFSASGLPTGLSIDANTGLISGTLNSSASTQGINGSANYSVIVTVNDGLGGSATQTFTFTAVNTLPVASNATVNLLEDTSVTGTLANNASDADGDVLTYAVTSGPSHGSLQFNPGTGGYTYTPVGNYNGSDSFSYRVTDADGAVSTAVITFNVAPVYDAPQANGNLPALSANDSSVINLNVASSFSDADNRALTYSASGLPAGLSIDANTGLISGTLNSSASTQGNGGSGSYNIVITASDTLGGSATQAFVLTAVNTLPTASGTSLTLAEDTVATGDLHTLSGDADNDTLTYSVAQAPANGVLVINANGTYSYTPNANFNGTDSFSYRVTDADNATTVATISLTITPVYDAPSTNGPIAAQQANDSSTFNLAVGNRFADADGATLTFSATGLPAGVSIDPTSGLISGTLGSSASSQGTDGNGGAPGSGGNYSIVVTASDGVGGSISQTFVLTAINPAPVAGDAAISLGEHSSTSGNLNNYATDADRDALTFSIVSPVSNGNLALNANGSFTYTPNNTFVGSDSLTYRVTDADGGTSTAVLVFNVVADNGGPVPNGTISTLVANDHSAVNLNVAGAFIDNTAGAHLTYSASNLPTGLSIDSATGIITGTLDSSASALAPGGGGNYQVTITATDDFNRSATQSFTLSAVNTVPIANNATLTIGEDGTATGNLNDYVTDTDGDALTFSTVQQPSHGTLTINPVTGAYTYVPNANFNGTDNFIYQATDVDGGFGRSTVITIVTPAYDGPLPNGTLPTLTAFDHSSVNLNIANAFSDADGTALTYSASNLPTGLTLDPNTGLITGTLSSSASTLGSNGAGGAGGNYTVIITASDGLGGSATQSFTLVAVNTLPVASNATVNLLEDTPVSGSLASTSSDVDGDTLTFAAITQPAHGSLSLNVATGAYTYTPAGNFNGTDSFSYSVTDADGAVSNAMITFTVAPVYDAPVTTAPITAITANDHSSVSVNVTGNFSSPDNLPLTYSATGLPAGITLDPNTGLLGGTLSSSASTLAPGGLYTIVVSASDGQTSISQSFTLTAVNTLPVASNATVNLVEDSTSTGDLRNNATDADQDALSFAVTTGPTHGSLLFNANGSYTYTPNANFNGSDSFSYRVTDADSGTSSIATITFNVAAVYDAPTTNGTIAAQTGNDGSSFNLNVAGNFSDVDNTPLTYSASGLPTGLAIDPDTGLISGTLGSSASTGGSNGAGGPGNSYTVTVSATDGLNTVTQTFTLTAFNIAPTANNATVPLLEDSIATGNLNNYASDTDGDALTFSASTQPTHGVLVLNANGTFTYTPVANFNGADSFNYTVTDADGASRTATLTFNVAPVHDAPAVTTSIANLTANDHGSVSVNVSGNFTSVDNLPLTYSATGLPAGVTLDPATGLLSGTLSSSASALAPGGQYSIVVSASDGISSTSQTFVLTAVNTLPTATSSTVNLSEDTTANGDLRLSASDADQDALSFAVANGPAHGSLALNANGTYSYTPAANFNGSDSFTYTVTDADGAVTSATLTFNVAPAYDAPGAGTPIATVTANDHSSVSINAGGNFTNVDNATLTYSATGLPTGLSIDPATGLISGTLSSSASAQGSNGSGGANTGGNYSIVVSASDGINTATQTFTLTAVNTLPVAANANLALPAGSNVSASLLNYAQDADGDVLSFTANSVPTHGTLVLSANGSFTYTPTLGYIGTDTLTYTVTDADGASTTATLTFNVAAGYLPPAANGSVAPLNAADHSQVNVNVAGNFSDANGNPLTYSAAGLPTGLSIDPGTGLITGTLSSSASTQGIGGSGTYTVVITASDGLGGSATQTFALTAMNTLPSATGTTLNVNEDGTASGDLRSVVTDIDGDALSFAAVTPPAHGTLVLNANGLYTYTPAANFNGSDSFTYQVTDADGASATATIVINVAQVLDAPSANGSVAAQAANDGSSFSLSVAGNFNNPDNVPLSYSATGLPAGLAIDGNGLITGTLGSSASVLGSNGAGGPGGNYTVVVSVTDGTHTVTQSFVLTAINTVPTVSNASVPVPEDGSVTGDLNSIASDVDQDALTFSANSQPAHGVLVLNANGSYTYTPVANFNGSDSFNYTVTDADGASRTATLTFNVTPAYDAPSVTAQIATQTANDHSSVSLDVASNFTSVDNLPLTYSATGLPAGLSIDPNTGLISGTLSSSASSLGSNGSGGPGGNYSVVVSASDGISSVSQTFTLTAVNTLPTATNASVTVQQGSDLIGNLSNYASDADGDALSFTAATQPAHGVLSVGANGVYTYTPTAGFIGQDSFTYQVTDADGGVTLATVVVNVSTQPDQAPVVSAPVPTQTATDGATFNLNVANAFSDPDGDTLTYSVSGLPNGLTFNPQTGQITGTLPGNASSQAPGGVYTLTLTASDGTVSVSQQVELVVSNPLPVTTGASYTLPEDSSISGVLTASDPDGDSFTFGIAQGPTHGSLTLNANGSFTYVPNPDFNGTDSFTYQVRDSDGGITNAVVSFTVTPVNDTPVLVTPPGTVVVPPDGPTVIDVLPGISDADGDPLTVVGAGASSGTVVINPNGTLTYTPAPGYSGPATLTYTVSDGAGGSLTATITLSVSAAPGNGGGTGTGSGTGTGGGTGTGATTPDGFVGVTSTQIVTAGLTGIPPSYTSPEFSTYARVTHYDPVLLDAVNGVKRLDGLTQLSEDRPMQEVATGMAPLAATTEISSNAAPMAQATGDLQEQNRQQLDVDDMRAGAPGTTQEAPTQAPPAATEPATAPGAAAPETAPQQAPGSGGDNPQANNVTPLPLTLNEQLQAASQARLAERDALARLLAS